MITAYRRPSARQSQEAAAQKTREIERARRKLEADAARLDAALESDPRNPLLKADRAELAMRKFSISAGVILVGSSQGFQEPALIPEPVQPQRVRATAVGALLGLVFGAALSWLLTW